MLALDLATKAATLRPAVTTGHGAGVTAVIVARGRGASFCPFQRLALPASASVDVSHLTADTMLTLTAGPCREGRLSVLRGKCPDLDICLGAPLFRVG
ncbi:hypothetical protein MOKP4_49130 [Mycobacterium avium subsp. hominissuis]